MLTKTFLSITATAVVSLGLLAGVSAPAHSTQVSDSASVLSAKKKPAAKKKAAAKKPAVKQVSKKAAKKAKKAAKKAKKKAAKKAAQCKTKKQKKTAKCKKAKKPAIPTAPRGNWTTVGATDLGVAPAANMILNPMGRPILTLHSYNGSIFYGMGNYDVNAGGAAGISVASYSPSSGWSTLLSGFATEEINTFRNYGGKLYTPNVDPSSGYTSGQVFASNASGAWSPSPSTGSISAEHVFDVAVVSHGIYVAGSSNSGAATLWRSTNGGASWTIANTWVDATPADRDGYERYYWIGVIGNDIYIQADRGTKGTQIPPLQKFNGTSWSNVSGSICSSNLGSRVRQASYVLSADNKIWCVNSQWGRWPSALEVFDGAGTSYPVIGLDARSITKAPNGSVYVLGIATDGKPCIYKIIAGTLTPQLVWKPTFDTWISVDSGLAVLDGYAYMAQNQTEPHLVRVPLGG